MEFTLLAAALTGVFFLWFAVRLLRDRLVDVDRPADLLVGAAGVGIFAGRVFEMITSGVNPITNPFDVILIRGGVDTVAASLTAIAVVVWARRSHLASLDALAPAALAGLAGWHAGCLWTGSCLGSVTGGDWGFALAGSDVLRHPTEIYAAILLLTGAVVVSKIRLPLAPSGVALAVAGASRLVTEPIRPSIVGGPVGWYAAAIGVGLAVAVVGSRASRRSA